MKFSKGVDENLMPEVQQLFLLKPQQLVDIRPLENMDYTGNNSLPIGFGIDAERFIYTTIYSAIIIVIFLVICLVVIFKNKNVPRKQYATTDGSEVNYSESESDISQSMESISSVTSSENLQPHHCSYINRSRGYREYPVTKCLSQTIILPFDLLEEESLLTEPNESFFLG